MSLSNTTSPTTINNNNEMYTTIITTTTTSSSSSSSINTTSNIDNNKINIINSNNELKSPLPTNKITFNNKDNSDKPNFYDLKYEFDAPQYLDFHTIDLNSNNEESFEEWFQSTHINHEKNKELVSSTISPPPTNKSDINTSSSSSPPISNSITPVLISPIKDNNINLNNTNRLINGNIKSLFKDLSGTLKPERVSVSNNNNSNSEENLSAALEQIKLNLPPKPIRLSNQNLKRFSASNSSTTLSSSSSSNSTKISHCRLSSLNRRFSKLSTSAVSSTTAATTNSATNTILNTISSKPPLKRASTNQINNISKSIVKKTPIDIKRKSSLIITPINNNNNGNDNGVNSIRNSIGNKNNSISNNNNNNRKSMDKKLIIKPSLITNIKDNTVPCKLELSKNERLSISTIKKRRSNLNSSGILKDRFICNGNSNNSTSSRLSIRSNININSKLNYNNGTNSNNSENEKDKQKPVNKNPLSLSTIKTSETAIKKKQPLIPPTLSNITKANSSTIPTSLSLLNSNNKNLNNINVNTNTKIKVPTTAACADTSNKENSINMTTTKTIPSTIKKPAIATSSSLLKPPIIKTDKKPPLSNISSGGTLANINNKNKIPIINGKSSTSSIITNNNSTTTKTIPSFFPQDYSKIIK